MSELIKHFNKFEETREQLTERTLDESPTKVKHVLNEKQILNEDQGQFLRRKLLYNKIILIMNQEFNRDISFQSQKILTECINRISNIEDK